MLWVFNTSFYYRTNKLNKQIMKKIILTTAIILTTGILVSSGIIHFHQTEIKGENISKPINYHSQETIGIAD